MTVAVSLPSSGTVLPMRLHAHGTVLGLPWGVSLRKLPLLSTSPSLPPSPSLLQYPCGYVGPIIQLVSDIMQGDIGVAGDVGGVGVGSG
jgi:hypothetical protein